MNERRVGESMKSMIIQSASLNQNTVQYSAIQSVQQSAAQHSTGQYSTEQRNAAYSTVLVSCQQQYLPVIQPLIHVTHIMGENSC